MRILILVISLTVLGAFADPFTQKGDAVGYIVVEDEKGEKKYIVLSSEGKLELLEVEEDPNEILLFDEEGKEEKK